MVYRREEMPSSGSNCRVKLLNRAGYSSQGGGYSAVKKEVGEMRVASLMILFALCFIFVTEAGGSKNVLEKLIRSYGKTDALAAVQDLVQIWEFRDAGTNALATLTVKAKRPNKIRIEMTMGDVLIMTSVYDGTNGSHSVMGTVRKMSTKELQEYEYKARTAIDGFVNHTENGIELTVAKDTTVDGIGVHTILATDRHGNTQRILCQKQTGHVMRVEGRETDAISGQETETIVLYEEYKMIDGIFFSQRMVALDRTGGRMVFELKDVQQNVCVKENEFISK